MSRHQRLQLEKMGIVIDKPERPVFNIGKMSLAGVIEDLLEKTINPESECRIYEITNALIASDLQQLLSLPYEVELARTPKGLFLFTGSYNSGCWEKKIKDILFRSPFAMHTHPDTGAGRKNNIPSPQDYSHVPLSNSAFVLSNEGILEFCRPHSLSEETTLKEAKAATEEIIEAYGVTKGIDLIQPYGGSVRPIIDLPHDERYAFCRQMARDLNTIVDEVPWSDTVGINEILTRVNQEL